MKYFLSRIIVLTFATSFLFVSSAGATLYSPGQTLDPACAPTDSNCGIAFPSSAASGANSDITSLSALTNATSTNFFANVLQSFSALFTNATTTSLNTSNLTLGSGTGLLFSTGGSIGSVATSSLGAITLSLGSAGTDVNVSGSPALLGGTLNLNLPSASASNRGLLTASDWSTFNGKQNALGYTAEDSSNKSTDVNLGTSNTLFPTQNAVKSYIGALTFSGDISGTSTSIAVNKISGVGLNFASLASSDLLQYNGTNWVNVTPAALGIGALSYATSSDIYKYASSSIAAWGDSFTIGTGGGGTTYPGIFQSDSGVAVYNGGVSGETSTQIATRMLAATDKYTWPVIIWAGRNNYSSQSTVLADIASMVAALRTDNYLVLGILNNSTETTGLSSYNSIIALNSALSSTYGSHYVDVRTYLVSQYNAGIPQDVTDHNNDVVPSSLRSDTLHLNAAGYTLLGHYLYNNYFRSLVPALSHKVLSTDVIDTLKAYSLTNPVITGSLSLDAASTTQYGAIYKGGSRFIHDYFTVGNDGKNTFMGTNAGNFTMGSSTGSAYYGSYNSAVGYNALSSNTIGAYNAALGSYALQNNSTGKENVAIGNGAMQTNTTGSYNSVIGRSALSTNSIGAQNTVLGDYSMQLATGSNNSALGYHALRYQTSGTGNTAIGYNAGVGQTDVTNYNTTIDTYSTFIGFGASRASTTASTTALTNATAIGYNATVGISNALILGGTGSYAVNVGIGTTSPSAQLHTTGSVRFGLLTGAGAGLVVDANGNVTVSSDEKLKDIQGNFTRGLTEIEQLQPISFKWKPETGYDTVNTYSGFSAQNVQTSIPEAISTDSKGYLTLADRPIIAALVNAVKEIAEKLLHPVVGTPTEPAGITMYDNVTHLPYCLQMSNGALQPTSGECSSNKNASVKSNTIINEPKPSFPVINTVTNTVPETATSTSTTTLDTSASTSTPDISTVTQNTSTTTEAALIENTVASSTTASIVTESSDTTTSSSSELNESIINTNE